MKWLITAIFISSFSFALPSEADYTGRYLEKTFESESGKCSYSISIQDDGLMSVETFHHRKHWDDDYSLERTT